MKTRAEKQMVLANNALFPAGLGLTEHPSGSEHQYAHVDDVNRIKSALQTFVSDTRARRRRAAIQIEI